MNTNEKNLDQHENLKYGTFIYTPWENGIVTWLSLGHDKWDHVPDFTARNMDDEAFSSNIPDIPFHKRPFMTFQPEKLGETFFLTEQDAWKAWLQSDFAKDFQPGKPVYCIVDAPDGTCTIRQFTVANISPSVEGHEICAITPGTGLLKTFPVRDYGKTLFTDFDRAAEVLRDEYGYKYGEERDSKEAEYADDDFVIE
jgi:hypothetical protein